VAEPRGGLLLDVSGALYPGGGGGIGRYIRDLVAALVSTPAAPFARFAYSRNLRAPARDLAARDRLVELPFPNRVNMLLAMAAANFGWNLEPLYGRPAVFHSPNGAGPALRGSRLLLTIHDLTFLDHPEWHTTRNTAYMKATVPAAAPRADLVLCDSEYVRGKVIQRLGVSEDRAVTVPLAVDDAFRPVSEEVARENVARRFGIEQAFLLHVGSLEPRKNHLRLIEAFETVRNQGIDVLLVLVGPAGWRNDRIIARIADSPAAGSIRRLTGVSDHELAALYSACVAFALPSLEEGFGLPLAEAMACGAACIAADNSSLREIGMDGAILVPAEDATALARALRGLCGDAALRATWRARGLERSGRYRRDVWIGRMMGIYRDLIDAGVPAARSIAQ